MGDSETGIVVPVLSAYYAGSTALDGTVISIAADGVRYDLAVYSEDITLGRNKVEKLTAPLNAEGLDMIRAMLAAEEVNVYLVGEQTFKMQPEEKKNYVSTREELSARSMEALESMLNEFEAMGEYKLWDLNEDWWIRTRGMEPQFCVTQLPAEETEEAVELPVDLEEPMYLLSRGDTGNDVRDLQKLLVEAGYIQGAVDGGYGEGTVRAVRAAQKWLGLMPTGMADEKLVCLLSGEIPADNDPETISMKATELLTAEGLCELTVERSWFADAVESTKGDRRTVTDLDNTLVVYEGSIKNLSKEDLDFYWQLSAVAKYGEYEYPCMLVCERNEGATLASMLTPLGQARLLIYAEIPETIAGEGEWSLEITAGENTFEIK